MKVLGETELNTVKKYLKFMVKKTGKCYFNTVKKLLFKKKKCNPNLDGKSNVFYLEKSI